MLTSFENLAWSGKIGTIKLVHFGFRITPAFFFPLLSQRLAGAGQHLYALVYEYGRLWG
jgi:hypothetical protein